MIDRCTLSSWNDLIKRENVAWFLFLVKVLSCKEQGIHNLIQQLKWFIIDYFVKHK